VGKSNDEEFVWRGGDLPVPVKYFNPEIKTAYKAIESAAAHKLFHMVPAVLKGD
jgi:5'-deoxynucleotidase